MAARHGIQDHGSQPGVKPMTPAVEVWLLNQWTVREGPDEYLFGFKIISYELYIHTFPLETMIQYLLI